eukprot:jgi/Picsp_1/1183/NSC_04664-R1_zinc finger ccch domain-containing protein 56-like
MDKQGAAQGGGAVGQQSPGIGTQHEKMVNRQQYGMHGNNGYGMGGALPMPPEMMQGMGPPAMMMPQFQTPPPYGMVAYPSHAMMPMPMNPGMSPPMGGDHMHFQQLMTGGVGRGNTNVFYKTRMCNKWRGGSCPFGDRCTYAHGQHELRRVPPEVLAQFEREQAMQQQNTMGPAVQETIENENDKVQQEDQDDQPQQKPKSQLYYKTRLCIRYMQSGYCARGSACTFAHGYEDLRLLSSSSAAAATAPSTMEQDNGNNKERGMDEDEDEHKQGHDELTPAQARARAMCAIAGVGNAAKYASEEEVKKAKESLEDGSVFQDESPYADAME